MDAAFVATGSNMTLSNSIVQDNSALGSSTGSVPSRSTVYMAGTTTGKVVSGTVVNVNQSFSLMADDNKTVLARLTGIYQATYGGKKGDSGAVVYLKSNSVQIIVGNHLAAGGWFGLISPILTEFGAKVY